MWLDWDVTNRAEVKTGNRSRNSIVENKVFIKIEYYSCRERYNSECSKCYLCRKGWNLENRMSTIHNRKKYNLEFGL